MAKKGKKRGRVKYKKFKNVEDKMSSLGKIKSIF